MVMPMVASAMEGAAPNSPAKLLGLKISASTAKIETTAPPIKKRRTSSVIPGLPIPKLRGAPGLLDEAPGRGVTLTTQQPELFALEPVIVDEELFQFLHE